MSVELSVVIFVLLVIYEKVECALPFSFIYSVKKFFSH